MSAIVSILDILATVDSLPEERIRNFTREVKSDDVVIGEVGLRARKLHAIIAELAEKLEEERQGLLKSISQGDGLMDVLMGTHDGLESLKKDLATLRLLREIFDFEVGTSLNVPEDKRFAIVVGWKVIEDSVGADSDTEEVLKKTDCGDPSCLIHGHLHKQASEEPTAQSESVN